jgi:hypothetical protein
VKSREEILGEALRQEEIKVCVCVCVCVKERRMLNVVWCGGRERWFAA